MSPVIRPPSYVYQEVPGSAKNHQYGTRPKPSRRRSTGNNKKTTSISRTEGLNRYKEKEKLVYFFNLNTNSNSYYMNHSFHYFANSVIFDNSKTILLIKNQKL